MPLDRLQLKIYAFSGKVNVCSKHALLSWINICRDFTLQTQTFTQKCRSWPRFYSEFLRKKLAVGGSGWTWKLISFESWGNQSVELTKQYRGQNYSISTKRCLPTESCSCRRRSRGWRCRRCGTGTDRGKEGSQDSCWTDLQIAVVKLVDGFWIS